MRALVVLVVLGLGGMAAFVWYAARLLERGVFRVWPRNDPLDIEVAEIREGAIGLRPLTRAGNKELRRPGEYGLEFEGGYAEVGPIVEAPDDQWATVWRELRGVRGPLQPGTRARMDSFGFEGGAARAIEWEDVIVDCPGGGSDAWLLSGDPERWAIFVHGKGARREEALRVLPLVGEEGWTCLAISYRNDADCGGRGYYAYGTEEWEDLEAAVTMAKERGATEVVLFGYSMGGAICLSFMRRSAHAGMVRGLVLDSPMTDLPLLLRLRMAQRRVPGGLTGAAMVVAGRRAGVAPGAAQYGDQAVDVPILLVHGEDDDVIPVALSERFVEGREGVTFVRVPGAGHVRSWNVDRVGYESVVREFLRGLPHPLTPSPRARGEGELDA